MVRVDDRRCTRNLMDIIPRKRTRTESRVDDSKRTVARAVKRTVTVDNRNIPVSRFQGTNRHELEIRLLIAQKRIEHLKGIIENASA